MKNKKTKRLILLLAVIVVLVPILSYHMYCHYMISRFYVCVDERNTEKTIEHIKKMPSVNMLDICVPFYHMKGVLTQYSANKGYPLQYALWNGADIEIIEGLLEKGANPNKVDLKGNSDSISLVFYKGKQENLLNKIELLVKYGADINKPDTMYIPDYFMECSEREKKEITDANLFLWEKGIRDKSHVGTEYECTVLHDMAGSMDLDCFKTMYLNEKRPMKYLLNEQDIHKETPLFYAVRNDNYEICLFLLEQGADTGIKNDKGQTAYDVAVENGYEDIARLLKSYRPDENYNGYKLFYGTWEVTELVSVHSRINIENPEGVLGKQIRYEKTYYSYDHLGMKMPHYDISIYQVEGGDFFPYQLELSEDESVSPPRLFEGADYFVYVRISNCPDHEKFKFNEFIIVDDNTLYAFEDMCVYKMERLEHDGEYNETRKYPY